MTLEKQYILISAINAIYITFDMLYFTSIFLYEISDTADTGSL